MDQGLFAISGFVCNLLLARWLPLEGYGAFGVAFTVFLLAGVFHTAFATDPMAVFGLGRYRARMADYLALLIKGQVRFSLAQAAMIACGAVALRRCGATQLAQALFYLALSLPPMLSLWAARRACYVKARPQEAAIAGSVQLAASTGGLVVLHYCQLLTAGSAFIAIGLASGVAFLTTVLRLRLLVGHQRLVKRRRRTIILRHWRYGRWVAGSSLASFASSQISMFLLPIYVGLHGCAELRALINLLMPAFVLNNAFQALAAPHLARHGRSRKLHNCLLRALAIMACMSIPSWVALGIMHHAAMNLIYSGRFLEHSALLWIAGVCPLCVGLGNVVGLALAAQERPRAIFAATLLTCIVSTFAGTWLIAAYGLWGAVVSMPIYGTLHFASLSIAFLIGYTRNSLCPVADIQHHHQMLRTCEG